MKKKHNPLENAEMAMEANYNMVGDGIINNTPPRGADLTDGQTFEEMRELAPETLPEARPEHRPSVLEHLKAPARRGDGPKPKPPVHDDMGR